MFRFLAESRLEPIALSADENNEMDGDRFITVLKIVSKIGMAILVILVLFMMYAARGTQNTDRQMPQTTVL